MWWPCAYTDDALKHSVLAGLLPQDGAPDSWRHEGLKSNLGPSEQEPAVPIIVPLRTRRLCCHEPGDKPLTVRIAVPESIPRSHTMIQRNGKIRVTWHLPAMTAPLGYGSFTAGCMRN